MKDKPTENRNTVKCKTLKICEMTEMKKKLKITKKLKKERNKEIMKTKTQYYITCANTGKNVTYVGINAN